MKRLQSIPAGAAALTGMTTTLTERDMDTLRHLAARRSTAQIAAAMSISGNTVRTRVRRLLRKLAATERGQAAHRARELGLL